MSKTYDFQVMSLSLWAYNILTLLEEGGGHNLYVSSVEL